MNADSTRKLKTDRRLIHRRGWISKSELQKQLDALPDVSDKIAPPQNKTIMRIIHPPPLPNSHII